MKIVDMQAYLLAIPIREKDFPAQWSWGNFNQIIVEIQTDEGITGYGEAFGYGVPQATASVIDQVLKPMLVGADPAKIPFLSDQLFRQTHLYGRYGITTFAISGVDIALWDILGKCAGLPLYRLLGGDPDRRSSCLCKFSTLQRSGGNTGSRFSCQTRWIYGH